MTTKSRRLSDLETAATPDAPDADIPSIMPIDDTTPARVRTTIDYNINAKPDQLPTSRYSKELQDLAATEMPLSIGPGDALSEFCDEWRDYTGVAMLRISRLPDPAVRRLPGQSYNRPWIGDVEALGEVPFDAEGLIDTLRFLNGNSGGVFRLWLIHNGQMLARLDRIAISDPPQLTSHNPSINAAAPAQSNIAITAPPKSAMEQRLETLQWELFESTLKRAMNPPAPVAVERAPLDPLAGLSEQDRAFLVLAREGNMMQSVFQRMIDMTQNAETAAQPAGWKDRAANALVGLVETNPALVERVSGVIERIVTRILPDPKPATTPIAIPVPPPPPQQLPPPAPVVNPIRADLPGVPEVPEPDDDNDQDADIMDIIERIFERLTDPQPLGASDKIFIELREAYPMKFRIAIGLIKKAELPDLIAWIIETAPPIYGQLLTSAATREYYIARVKELKDLIEKTTGQTIKTPTEKPNAETAQSESSTPAAASEPEPAA